MGKTNNIFKSKKLKYGSFAVVFIAVTVALVIALNLIVSFLDRKYDWRFDLTENQLYSLSEATDETLKTALGDKYSDFDITITFCAARDLFEYYDTANNEINKYYSSVRDIAEEYAQLYDGTDGRGKVTVRYVDITRDPAEANRLKQQAQLTTINWNNIIIQNTSNTEYYRVLGFDACYFRDEDTNNLYAFQAENKITAAIIQCVSAEKITVAFTTGHGESHGSRLEELFQLSTMNVVAIDLDNQDIPPEVKIIVISDPKYDFTYGAIHKLTRFMADKGTYNSLMVFVNADTPDLPNLRDYLQSWDLDYLPNHKITDENASLKQTDSIATLVGTYVSGENGNTAGYSICRTAAEAGLKSVFPNATALNPKLGGYGAGTASVSVYSSSDSIATYHDDEGKEVTEKGSFPLLAISVEHTYGNDSFNYNSNKYQYVMLCGSTEFASNEFLKNSYGNESIMYAVNRAMATDRVTLNIRAKVFKEYALTLESGAAKKLTILITAALPAIIVIIGIAVFFRRRHL